MAERANVQIRIDRVILSEVDRLATLWDLYRYEAVEHLLTYALKHASPGPATFLEAQSAQNEDRDG